MSKFIPKKIILDQLIKSKNKRISFFHYKNQKFWLKQKESSSYIKLLLNKNASNRLMKEKILLTKLGKLGMPVPDVIDFGEDYFILSDVGDAIVNIIEPVNTFYSKIHPKFHKNGNPIKEKILTKASIGLAMLHKKGYSHGRPSIKDICLKNNKIYFIDFEENKNNGDIINQQVRDLIIFIHSLYRFLGIRHKPINRIINAYRLNGGEKIWQISKNKIQKWFWLRYFFIFFKNSGSKDVSPVYWVFNFFKSQKNL